MPIVVRAQTYVQPREHAFRNAAAPPQKAVRHAAKRFGANYLDSIRHSSTPPVGNAAGIAQSGAVTASALKSTPISSGKVRLFPPSSREAARSGFARFRAYALAAPPTPAAPDDCETGPKAHHP